MCNALDDYDAPTPPPRAGPGPMELCCQESIPEWTHKTLSAAHRLTVAVAYGQSICNAVDGHVHTGGELAAADVQAPAPSRKINVCTAINDALHIALAADPKCALLRLYRVEAVPFLSPATIQRLSKASMPRCVLRSRRTCRERANGSSLISDCAANVD